MTDVQSVINKILSLSGGSSTGSGKRKKIELLIDGGVFAMMLQSDKATLKELNVALQNAAAVIIYRASPKQKQQVVQFIKEHNPGKITLSVGDGSNDVNMI